MIEPLEAITSQFFAPLYRPLLLLLWAGAKMLRELPVRRRPIANEPSADKQMTKNAHFDLDCGLIKSFRSRAMKSTNKRPRFEFRKRKCLNANGSWSHSFRAVIRYVELCADCVENTKRSQVEREGKQMHRTERREMARGSVLIMEINVVRWKELPIV